MVRPPRGSIKESQKRCYSTTEESQCIFLYSWMYVSCRSISVYCPVSHGSYMCPNNFPASVSQTSQTGASETTVSLHTSTFQLPPANASVSLVGASLCIMPVCLLKQELWETLTQLFHNHSRPMPVHLRQLRLEPLTFNHPRPLPVCLRLNH